MPVTDADQRQVIELLLGDLHATIGTAHDQLVLENATRLKRFIDETDIYIERVILSGFTTVGGGVRKMGF